MIMPLSRIVNLGIKQSYLTTEQLFKPPDSHNTTYANKELKIRLTMLLKRKTLEAETGSSMSKGNQIQKQIQLINTN